MTPDLNIILIGIVLLMNAASLFIGLVKSQSGREGHRQVEPTQIASIQAAIVDVERKLSEAATKISALKAQWEMLSADFDNSNKRIHTLSTDVARLGALVERK
jgi:peptidoglycan hydrolase CwlO-like protein